jgi:hypothetical protein
MLIDLIVGAAVLLFGLFLYFWLRSAALRERIERPKHVFLEHARRQDGAAREPARTTFTDWSPGP